MVSELVKRLRHHDEYDPLGHDGWEAADLIEQLERELAEANSCHDTALSLCNFGTEQINRLSAELLAEKALADQGADRVSRWVGFDDGDGGDAAFLAAYRKARGL